MGPIILVIADILRTLSNGRLQRWQKNLPNAGYGFVLT